MKLKIDWLALLLLLFCFFPVQFSKAVSQASQTMTNYGSIVVFDPATGILWETGAESGIIGAKPVPPFDFAGPMGDGSRTGSYAVVTDEQARTGTKAIKLYQVPPTKSDAQRRVTMRQWTHTKNELYASWWMYFPDNMGDAGGSGQWTTLGGINLRYGPSDWRHKYHTAFEIFLNDGSPRRIVGKWRENYNGDEHFYSSDFYLNSTYLNKWIHFQIYFKFGVSNGVYRAWIGDGTTTQTIANLTGINTDPASSSRWDSENLGFAYPNNGIYFASELYQPTNSPERWYYADDVVLSDTKVSQSYGVVNE